MFNSMLKLIYWLLNTGQFIFFLLYNTPKSLLVKVNDVTMFVPPVVNRRKISQFAQSKGFTFRISARLEKKSFITV